MNQPRKGEVSLRIRIFDPALGALFTWKAMWRSALHVTLWPKCIYILSACPCVDRAAFTHFNTIFLSQLTSTTTPTCFIHALMQPR